MYENFSYVLNIDYTSRHDNEKRFERLAERDGKLSLTSTA